MISSAQSSSRPVKRIPQGSVLVPVMLNVIFNDLDDGAECTFSKSADVTKPGEVDDSSSVVLSRET